MSLIRYHIGIEYHNYHTEITCLNIFPQTLCALIQGVFRKSSSDHGFDILDILMGFDAAEGQMQVGVATLIIHCSLRN